jgi:hypothetical protein
MARAASWAIALSRQLSDHGRTGTGVRGPHRAGIIVRRYRLLGAAGSHASVTDHPWCSADAACLVTQRLTSPLQPGAEDAS